MAETKKKESPTKEAESASDASSEKFPVERLIADSGAFLGVPPHVAAGGLHGVTKDLNIEEAKAAVEKWLSSPVQTKEA